MSTTPPKPSPRFSPSQIIATLILKAGGEPITLTIAELQAWQSFQPTIVTTHNDGRITISVDPLPSDFSPG